MTEDDFGPLPATGRLEIDERLSVRRVDSGMLALCGDESRSLVGQPLDALFSPRDRRGALQFYESINRAEVTRVDMMLTLQLGARDVPTRLRMWRSGAGWSACVEELGEGNLVQELVAARERWRQIIKESAEGVAVLGPGGRIEDFNATFFSQLDFRSSRGVPLTEEALRGARLADLVTEESLAPLRAVLAAGGERCEMELQHRGRWHEIVARPLSRSWRGVAGTCVQVRDITARRNSELLVRQKEAAEAASAAKSLFLSSMSHELRTPLNAIIGYCELLLEDAREREDNALTSDLERIGLSARHLLDLVRNILDLSAIEAGKVTLRPEDVDVRGLLSEVRSALQPLAENQQSALVVRCEATVGVVSVDLLRLRQVLLNLVGNAVKFTRQGEIVVSARRVAGPGGERLEIAVADTGVGISEDRLAGLFQEFVREAAASMVEGAGLGLVVSRRLVRLMGGDIRVQSELGHGSVFTVDLPV